MAIVAHIASLTVFHFQERFHGPKRSQLLPGISLLVAGVLLIAVPLWSWIVVIASPTEVIRNLVLIPMETYARNRSLPFPSLSAIAVEVAHLRLNSITEIFVFLPLVATLIGAVTALRFPGGRIPGTPSAATIYCCRRGALLLLVSFSLLFFFKGFVRVSVLHMALAIVPALPTLIICMMCYEHRGGFAGLLAAYMVLVSVVPVYRCGIPLIRNLLWVSQPARGVNECHFVGGLDRIGCFQLSPNELDTIRFVQERTTDDERIFVGLIRHDRIVINNILFYFVSKRLSATKWHQFDPGVQTSREIQSEMITEFEQKKPRLIVLNGDWDNVREPNDSSISSGVTMLDEFIRTHYHRAATFGSTHVYLLRV